MEVGYLDLVGEGYMGSMQWQLGREMGTIPAFASRTQENLENLCRDGENLCRDGENLCRDGENLCRDGSINICNSY